MLDHLIAASFSLWRAVFLAENVREPNSVRVAQKLFLATVISTNAIGFGDDKRSSAWSVGFYLENAKHRLTAAHLIISHHRKDLQVQDILPLLRLSGTYAVELTRYEWESIHAALRTLLKALDPACKLPIEPPTVIFPDRA